MYFDELAYLVWHANCCIYMVVACRTSFLEDCKRQISPGLRLPVAVADTLGAHIVSTIIDKLHASLFS
jgi:hypothetical protein